MIPISIPPHLRFMAPAIQTTSNYELRIRYIEDVVALLLAKKEPPSFPSVSSAPLTGSFRYSIKRGLEPILPGETATLLSNNWRPRESVRRKQSSATATSSASPTATSATDSIPALVASNDNVKHATTSVNTPTDAMIIKPCSYQPSLSTTTAFNRSPDKTRHNDQLATSSTDLVVSPGIAQNTSVLSHSPETRASPPITPAGPVINAVSICKIAVTAQVPTWTLEVNDCANLALTTDPTSSSVPSSNHSRHPTSPHNGPISATSSKPASVASQPSQSLSEQTLPTSLAQPPINTIVVEPHNSRLTSPHANTPSHPTLIIESISDSHGHPGGLTTPDSKDTPAHSAVNEIIVDDALATSFFDNPAAISATDITSNPTTPLSSTFPTDPTATTPGLPDPVCHQTQPIIPPAQPDNFEAAAVGGIKILDDEDSNSIDAQLAPEYSQATLDYYNDIQEYLQQANTDETEMKKKKKKKKKKSKPTSTPDNPILFYTVKDSTESLHRALNRRISPVCERLIAKTQQQPRISMSEVFATISHT
ncbi:hypothetical protein PGT21_003612 [Puccinia graminis f. sp. tritici]|uniref:Uncharacterized protein n=1 Tax=Puccinia graminis f. sp. tritici TaxID=56615 RepID=A0A5B0QHC1_PUCGR|nr:hypothetical protein PGTUg99_030401 [Puccinia graminis f. sp. tritici]KAA1112616.1 hypothetical protein PGT21_003612 [Puccinia graminis f. sp. tritici]